MLSDRTKRTIGVWVRVACAGTMILCAAIVLASISVYFGDTWPTALRSFLTFMAIVVALASDEIKRRIWQPIVNVEKPEGARHFSAAIEKYLPEGAQVGHENLRSSFYVRVRIRNSGTATAENVFCVLSRIYRRDVGGLVDRDDFMPLRLRWTFGNEAIDEKEVVYANVPSGAERLLDLGRIPLPDVLPEGEFPAEWDDAPLVFHPHTELESRGLFPGSYVLVLQVGAEQIDPVRACVAVRIPDRLSELQSKLRVDISVGETCLARMATDTHL